MEISKATLKDQKRIADLYNRFHPERNQKNPKPIKNFKAKGIILIASENKKIAGFICASYIDHGFYNYGLIEELFVEKNFRRRRVGLSLVKSIVNELRKSGAGIVFATTGKYNSVAIKLYKKAGFFEDKRDKRLFKTL